jgi:small subunit ribosomal protein S8
MVKDTVANLIIKLKNGGLAGKASVTVPTSKFNQAILALLEREGYIKSFGKSEGGSYDLEVVLAYDADESPKISSVERVSKLSKRAYSGAKMLRSVRSGFGMLVLTTPKGIMSDKEARKQNIGGEVLFKIW